MKRLLSALLAAALAAAIMAGPAGAFELKDTTVTFTDENGQPSMKAGSHPFAWTQTFNLNTTATPAGPLPEAEVKDLTVKVPTGMAVDPKATLRCSAAEFAEIDRERSLPNCANSSVVGIAGIKAEFSPTAFNPNQYIYVPVYNLIPPPGVTAKFGFIVLGVPVTIDGEIEESFPYHPRATVTNISQVLLFYGTRFTLWGNPADSAHDPIRGSCLDTSIEATVFEEPVSLGKCPANITNRSFLTLPTSCTGPLPTLFSALAWNTGDTASAEPLTSGDLEECGKLEFSSQISSQPTNTSAEGPSGLDFTIDIADEGLRNPKGFAHSALKKAVVTLPEGVTINPSQAEGLGVCSEADLARETAFSPFGAGCPASSKVGTIEVESPLLEEEPLKGSLFVAKPYENPVKSLIALYMTIKSPERGISIKSVGKVEPDPRTGQLITTVDDIPQLPFSHFKLHFREGGRSPLVTPPACGTYETKAVFTPWANTDSPFPASSSFKVTSGVGGGPCPGGGVPPFHPGFEAGSINNSAGIYSPFYMRLTRADGEQDMTRFSSILPRGVTGKIAGLAKCSDAGIAAAKAKSGLQELASPSCPAGSQIGRVLAGAGVGAALTYVPGKVYFAGPYNGNPLSVVAVVPAVAGPFDVGTVVTRVALKVNPETAEVEVDGQGSDPIPHILAGIPLKVRDLRIYADRPNFTLNPTNCEPSEAKATLFGGFLDVFSPADDVPVSLSARYQAASCASLAFKPKLTFKLSGGTQRGDYPALKAVLTPRPGDANVGKTVVTFPHSAFLEQSHIRTVCTRVQFRAHQCPQGSIYGHVKATTPLLDEVVEGPVYLRSSDHPLPDLVFALRGIVEVNVVTRIDSTKGRIRATLDSPPDLPVSKFILQMQGGKKGLIVNSRNLCAHSSKAIVNLKGQNGRPYNSSPPIATSCKGKKAKAKRRG